jgi:hypothetical protein
MTTKEKYIIHCPKCKTSFDVSKQMDNWKNELFKKIEKIIEEMKNDK